MDAAWAQVYAVWARVFVGLLQTGLIGWGLYLLQESSNQRNRQLDQQSQALQALGLGIQELLKRSEPHTE